jgi:NAD(P) transhydrogenase
MPTSKPPVVMVRARTSRTGAESTFDTNPRAVIAGGTEGMIKLVFQRSDRILLGVHILGDIASELIHLGQAVIRQHLPIDYFIETTFNVPTFTNSYKTAAYDGLIRLDRRSKV